MRKFFILSIILFGAFLFGKAVFAQNNGDIFQTDFKTPFDIAVDEKNNLVYTINIQTDDVVVMDGSSYEILGKIQLKDEPWAVIVNPLTSKVFVASFFGNAVYVIDGAAIAKDRFKTNPNPAPTRLAGFQEPLAIISSSKTSDVFVLNGPDRKIITWIDASAPGYIKKSVEFTEELTGMALDEGLNKLFVAYYGKSLQVVDFSAPAPKIKNIAMEAPVYKLAIDQSLHKVYGVTNNNSLAVVDGIKEIGIESIKEIGNTEHATLAINSKTHRIYLSGYWLDSLYVIDAEKDAVIRQIRLEDDNLGQSIIDEAFNKIYVLGGSKAILYTIDGDENKVVGQKAFFSRDAFLNQKMLNSSTREIYIPKIYSGAVAVYDISKDRLTVVPEQETGDYQAGGFFSFPVSTVYDSALEKLYVGNLSGFITVVDGKSLYPLKTIAVGKYPVSMYLLQDLGKLYVVSNDQNALYIINTKKDKVIKTIRLGSAPTGSRADYQIKYDAFNKHLAISEANSLKLYIVDAIGDSLAQTLDTSQTIGASFGYSQAEKAFIRYDADKGLIHFFDEKDLSLKRNIETYKGGWVLIVAAGKFYLVMPDRTVYVLTMDAGKLIKTFQLNHNELRSQLYVPAQNRLYLGFRYGIEIVDTGADEVVKSYNTENRYNYIFSASGDSNVYAYDYLVSGSKNSLYVIDQNGDLSAIPINHWLPSRQLPAVDSAGKRVFMAAALNNDVLAVDVSSAEVTAIPDQPNPLALPVKKGIKEFLAENLLSILIIILVGGGLIAGKLIYDKIKGNKIPA